MKDTSDNTKIPSKNEERARAAFVRLVADCPIPREDQLENPGLFLKRQDLTRLLLMHDLYRKILDVPGVIMEFGTRWGNNLTLYCNLRGIYEPFNHNRKVIGFDTFEGLRGVSEKDGAAVQSTEGNLTVTEGYEAYLEQVLAYHESESPIPHIKKYELVKGDVQVTLPEYLTRHPETIVALAYFDMDIHAPTKAALEALAPRLTKGSVLAFDELNCAAFPGETLALMETLGIGRYRLQRNTLCSLQSYLVIE